MTEEKEIQKLAFIIKIIDKCLKVPQKNPVCVFPNYEDIATCLFPNGYRSAYLISKEFFTNTKEYILKWYSLSKQMTSAECVSGIQEICSTAVFELENFEKKIKKEFLVEKFFKKKTEERENEIEIITKIIQSFAIRSETSTDEVISESKRIAKLLLFFGYSNYEFFLLFFISQAEKYFEEEWKKIERERENEERSESYISGKIFLLERLGEKMKEIKEEIGKGKENE